MQMDSKKLLIILLFIPLSIFSQELRVALENDVFFHSDDDYTHGTLISYTKLVDKEHWLFKKRVSHQTYTIGQFIYTPDDLKNTELITNDRPYAGLLYLDFTEHMQTKNRLQSFSILGGIVGPHSYSEISQKTIHKWIDSTYPEGWANQLSDEIVVNISYSDKYTLFGDKYKNLIYGYGASLGNLSIDLSIESTFKFGYNIPSKINTIRLEPYPRNIDDFYIYSFISLGGRAIGRNLTLDGNTFTDSASVEKEIFVGDLITGITTSYKSFEITYYVSYRTKEYKGQDGYSTFGGLSFNFLF